MLFTEQLQLDWNMEQTSYLAVGEKQVHQALLLAIIVFAACGENHSSNAVGIANHLHIEGKATREAYEDINNNFNNNFTYQ